MGAPDKLDQELTREDRRVEKIYFALQSERFIKLSSPDDIENSDDDELSIDLSSTFDEGENNASHKEFVQSEIQIMVEYYRLAFRAIKVGHYLIAALSLVEYLQKIFLLSYATVRDEAGNLFYGDSDDGLLSWVGNT